MNQVFPFALKSTVNLSIEMIRKRVKKGGIGVESALVVDDRTLGPDVEEMGQN
jgi:predicted ABC-type ATPase